MDDEIVCECAEDLIYEVIRSYNNYLEYASKSDYVKWSVEAEREAYSRYRNLEKSLIDWCENGIKPEFIKS